MSKTQAATRGLRKRVVPKELQLSALTERIESQSNRAQLEEFRQLITNRTRAFLDASPYKVDGARAAGVTELKEGETHLTLEPCDSDRRYVIHEVAQDFNLTSASEGEDDDRHVVMYMPQFAPEEEVVPQLALLQQRAALAAAAEKAEGTLKRSARQQSSTPAGAPPPPPPPSSKVERLDQVRRDRRTIEELMQARRKEKKKKGK